MQFLEFSVNGRFVALDAAFSLQLEPPGMAYGRALPGGLCITWLRAFRSRELPREQRVLLLQVQRVLLLQVQQVQRVQQVQQVQQAARRFRIQP